MGDTGWTIVAWSIGGVAVGLIVLRLVVEIPPVKRWWRRRVERKHD
jgi:hypothetical protein